MYARLFDHLKRGFESLIGPLGGRSNSVSTLNDEEETSDALNAPEKEIVDETVAQKETQGLDAANISDKKWKKSTTPTNDWTDPFLRSLLYNSRFKNWIKVALALRVVCEYISPTLEETVVSMHKKLLEKHGRLQITQADIEQYRKFPERSVLLFIWMKDVVEQHRTIQMPGIEVLMMCDPKKWPTEDGAWEIARAFMKRGCRSGEDGRDASSFDISSLLNFMNHCKAMGGHISSHSVTRVLRVRDSLMRSPLFQIDDKKLEENFGNILELFNDKQFTRVVGKSHRNKCLQTFEKVKALSLDLLATDPSKPKSPSGKTPSPSGNTFMFLQDAVSQILSEVPISAENAAEIQNQIQNFKTNFYANHEEEEETEMARSSMIKDFDEDCDFESHQALHSSKQSEDKTSRKNKTLKRKRSKSRQAKSETSVKRKKQKCKKKHFSKKSSASQKRRSM